MALEIKHRDDFSKFLINGDSIEKVVYVDNHNTSSKSNGVFYWSKLEVLRKTIFEISSDKNCETFIFLVQGELSFSSGPTDNYHTFHSDDVLILYSGTNGKIQMKLDEGDILFVSKFVYQDDLFVDDSDFKVYKSEEFPIKIEQGKNVKIFLGEDSPFESTHFSTQISEVKLAYKVHKIKLNKNCNYQLVLAGGKMIVNDKEMTAYDYCSIKDADEAILHVKDDSRMYLIESC